MSCRAALFAIVAGTALSACSAGVQPAGAPLSPSAAAIASLHAPARLSGGPTSITRATGRSAMLTPGATRPAWMRLAGNVRAQAYVSQFNLTTVSDYREHNKKNAPPRCEIGNEPYVNGIGVDASGNLWVPSGGEFTGVTTEFAPNCGKALFSIADTNGQPGAVAFDSKGTVYIENISGTSSDFLGSINVYAPGKKKPSTTLTDASSFLWFDEAIDSADNVYAVYSDVYNKGHVIEFAGGKNPATDLPMTLGFPGGLAFDGAGNLLVVDQDAESVSVYAPPFTGPAIATFRLQADSVPCRFARGAKQLYCADFTNASIDVYAYDASNPGATSYLYSFTNGIQKGSENAGIALAPAP
jgi:sugar lactone lactonase YvrE